MKVRVTPWQMQVHEKTWFQTQLGHIRRAVTSHFPIQTINRNLWYQYKRIGQTQAVNSQESNIWVSRKITIIAQGSLHKSFNLLPLIQSPPLEKNLAGVHELFSTRNIPLCVNVNNSACGSTCLGNHHNQSFESLGINRYQELPPRCELPPSL